MVHEAPIKDGWVSFAKLEHTFFGGVGKFWILHHHHDFNSEIDSQTYVVLVSFCEVLSVLHMREISDGTPHWDPKCPSPICTKITILNDINPHLLGKLPQNLHWGQLDLDLAKKLRREPQGLLCEASHQMGLSEDFKFCKRLNLLLPIICDEWMGGKPHASAQVYVIHG